MLHGHDKPSVGQLVLDQEGRYEGHAAHAAWPPGKHGEQPVARPAHVVGDVSVPGSETTGAKRRAGCSAASAAARRPARRSAFDARPAAPAAHRHRILAHQEMRRYRPVGVAEVQRGVELVSAKRNGRWWLVRADRDLRVQPLETLEPRQQPLRRRSAPLPVRSRAARAPSPPGCRAPPRRGVPPPAGYRTARPR